MKRPCDESSNLIMDDHVAVNSNMAAWYAHVHAYHDSEVIS